MRCSSIMLLLMLVSVAWGQDQETVQLRFAHFSPDAPAVDMYINDEMVVQGATYTDISDWLFRVAEPIEVSVTVTGDPLEQALLGPMEFDFQVGTWQVVTVIGLAEFDSLRLHAVEEDHSEIAFGETRITVFNAVSDGLPVTFAAGNTQLVSGLSYPSIQVGNDGAITANIVAQTYDLRLSDSRNARQVFFELDDIRLGRGSQYFVAALGYQQRPTGVFINSSFADARTEVGIAEAAPPLEDTNPQIQLRVANLSADAPSIGVYLNENLVELQAVRPLNLSEWLRLPAETYEIAIVSDGDPYENDLLTLEEPLTPGVWYTIALVGSEEAGTLAAQLIEEDYSELPTGESRMTFFNAVPDSPQLEVLINGQGEPIPLPFIGEASTGVQSAVSTTVPSDTYDIEILADGGDTPYIDALTGVPLVAGNHYYIGLVAGADGTPGFLLDAITQQAVIDRLE